MENFLRISAATKMKSQAAPQPTPSSWLRRKDLPDRYGPITTTGARGPLRLRRMLRPSCSSCSFVWPSIGETTANLHGALPCLEGACVHCV